MKAICTQQGDGVGKLIITAETPGDQSILFQLAHEYGAIQPLATADTLVVPGPSPAKKALVLRYLQGCGEPRTADDIAAATLLPTANVRAYLSTLCVDGLVHIVMTGTRNKAGRYRAASPTPRLQPTTMPPRSKSPRVHRQRMSSPRRGSIRGEHHED